jgi:hypothetical protein
MHPCEQFCVIIYSAQLFTTLSDEILDNNVFGTRYKTFSYGVACFLLENQNNLKCQNLYHLHFKYCIHADFCNARNSSGSLS